MRKKKNKESGNSQQEQKKKKKKRKKKPKKEEEEEEENDEEEEKGKEEEELKKLKENKYKAFWDIEFSNKPLLNTRFQDNSVFRVLKNWEEKEGWKQTNPPTIPIEDQFPEKKYPIGECFPYTNLTTTKTTEEEKREIERLHYVDYNGLRKAAECHKQVRKYAQTIIRPGQRLIDICHKLENMNRFLINQRELECGIGFPTGCSLNHVAAHYTPNPGDFRTIEYNDVCKIDFGTHVNGLIIDCAFSVAFNPMFDDLLYAVQDATNTGVKEAGIDVRLGDIGAAIQEVMESYEVTINNKVYPIKSVKNLCGHTIEPYKIHAGKSVPIVKTVNNTRMEEGELYAIETFGSTGKGFIYEDSDNSHFMKKFGSFNKKPREKSKALYYHINKTYSTLAFCRRWLEDEGFKNHTLALKYLVDDGLVDPYPPLSDVPGCYVAQFEHTFLLRPTCKEVFSRSDDY